MKTNWRGIEILYPGDDVRHDGHVWRIRRTTIVDDDDLRYDLLSLIPSEAGALTKVNVPAWAVTPELRVGASAVCPKCGTEFGLP